MPESRTSNEVYCPECDAAVRAHIVRGAEVEIAHDSPVERESGIAICPRCGSVLDEPPAFGENE